MQYLTDSANEVWKPISLCPTCPTMPSINVSDTPKVHHVNVTIESSRICLWQLEQCETWGRKYKLTVSSNEKVRLSHIPRALLSELVPKILTAFWLFAGLVRCSVITEARWLQSWIVAKQVKDYGLRVTCRKKTVTLHKSIGCLSVHVT